MLVKNIKNINKIIFHKQYKISWFVDRFRRWLNAIHFEQNALINSQQKQQNINVPKNIEQAQQKFISQNKLVSTIENTRMKRIDEILGTNTYYHKTKIYQQRLDSDHIMDIQYLKKKKQKDILDMSLASQKNLMQYKVKNKRKYYGVLKNIRVYPRHEQKPSNFTDETNPQLINFLGKQTLYSKLSMAEVHATLASLNDDKLMQKPPKQLFRTNFYVYFKPQHLEGLYRIPKQMYNPKILHDIKMLMELESYYQEIFTLTSIYNLLQQYYEDERVHQYLKMIENGLLEYMMVHMDLSVDQKQILIILDLLGNGEQYCLLHKFITRDSFQKNVIFNIRAKAYFKYNDIYYVQKNQFGIFNTVLVYHTELEKTSIVYKCGEFQKVDVISEQYKIFIFVQVSHHLSSGSSSLYVVKPELQQKDMNQNLILIEKGQNCKYQCEISGKGIIMVKYQNSNSEFLKYGNQQWFSKIVWLYPYINNVNALQKLNYLDIDWLNRQELYQCQSAEYIRQLLVLRDHLVLQIGKVSTYNRSKLYFKPWKQSALSHYLLFNATKVHFRAKLHSYLYPDLQFNLQIMMPQIPYSYIIWKRQLTTQSNEYLHSETIQINQDISINCICSMKFIQQSIPIILFLPDKMQRINTEVLEKIVAKGLMIVQFMGRGSLQIDMVHYLMGVQNQAELFLQDLQSTIEWCYNHLNTNISIYAKGNTSSLITLLLNIKYPKFFSASVLHNGIYDLSNPIHFIENYHFFGSYSTNNELNSIIKAWQNKDPMKYHLVTTKAQKNQLQNEIDEAQEQITGQNNHNQNNIFTLQNILFCCNRENREQKDLFINFHKFTYTNMKNKNKSIYLTFLTFINIYDMNSKKKIDENMINIELMNEDFLGSENECGRTLLDLVSRGSALLAQLQRLHLHIPKIFSHPSAKYGKIIHDFTYFKQKQMNEIENQIQSKEELVELNENLHKNYLPLLERFFQLFQAIIVYYQSLIDFINEIQTGYYMQFSLENMFQYSQGKQLLCQAIYLFGVLLLLLDELIDGRVRQRIVVCYFRYKGRENINKIKQVRKLCCDTGFLPQNKRTEQYKRPQNYPEEYFGRFPFENQLMEYIIVAIKDDDIYKQMPAYPQIKMRSFALSTQASMIFVLLFFRPDVLMKSKSTMRQIVDKHFYNCWVLPFYLGYISDLTQWWKPYKAAKLALNNILDVQTIQELCNEFVLKIAETYHKCKQVLMEGVMTEQYVITNINSLMSVLRQANVSLRWLILHRKTTQQKLNQIVTSSSNNVDILKLMLICSEFESYLKDICIKIVDIKQDLWNNDKTICADRLKEISEYFGKDHSFGKIQADESLQKWFEEISEAIRGVSFSNSTYASRRIQSYITVLQDIEHNNKIQNNLQIKQYLWQTRKDMDHMVKIINVKPSTITSIEIVCDITWSWIALKDYIKLMQKQVRRDPDISLLLKNTFMKLSSILNTPMIRIIQAKSQDTETVSKFYSNQLIKIVKDVLQIIPELVFENLGNIVNILTQKLQQQPIQFNKSELIKYVQNTQRYEISKYTNQISVFTESILNMQNYLIGVIEVNPKQVLQTGIKRQLIKLIANILQSSLTVDSKTPQAFVNKISKLSFKMQSLKLSLEYIQDFIHIYGLKFYYEQFEKLINCYVDMQRKSLLTQHIGYEELSYQVYIPMPSIKNDKCNSFMGWILNEIIALTNFKKCTFLTSAFGFYDWQTGKEILTLKTLRKITSCIGISGLQGIDSLIGLKIQTQLHKLIKQIRINCSQQVDRKVLETCYAFLKNTGSFSAKYESSVSKLKKHFKNLCTTIANDLITIGNEILLRDMICLQLKMLAKVGAPRLNLVLQNINNSILSDLTHNQRIYRQYNKLQESNQSLLLTVLSPYFAHMGIFQPIKKIYITTPQIQHLTLLIFITVSSYIGCMDYDNRAKSLMRVKKEVFDPNYFLAGLVCLMQQFPISIRQAFFAYMASYIKSSLNFILNNKEISKNPEVIGDLFTYVRFFEEYFKFSRQANSNYKEIIDLSLFASLDRETLQANSKNN